MGSFDLSRIAAGPGWVNKDGYFVWARSLEDLIAAAEAGAELLAADPELIFPDVPRGLIDNANLWRRFSEPEWETLKLWPGDAQEPEAAA